MIGDGIYVDKLLYICNINRIDLFMSVIKAKPYSNKSLIFAHLGALLCVLMWGISFVSTKVLLNNEMPPAEIYIYRFALAYLLILLFKRTKWMSHNWRDEMLMCLCGVLAGSVYFMSENIALQYTLVSNVSLLTSTSPLLTVLIVSILYKNERAGAGMWIGSLVAFLGVGCTIFNSSFNIEINPLGDMLALLCALSWALYSLVLRRLNATYDVWFITRKTFFYGVITALPFLFVEPIKYGVIDVVTNTEVLLNLTFLGIGASLISYVLWAGTVKKLGAVKANNYLYLQPVITMIFSVLVLGEVVTFIGYLGCGLILGGLWLGDYLTRRNQMRR